MKKNEAPEDHSTALQLLSHPGQVLLFLARNPRARMRDIAGHLGVTERAVLKIVSDLESAGWLSRSRNLDDRRRCQYMLHVNQPPHHPAETGLRLASLLKNESE